MRRRSEAPADADPTPQSKHDPHDQGQEDKTGRGEPDHAFPPGLGIDGRDPVATVRALLRILMHGPTARRAAQKVIRRVFLLVDPSYNMAFWLGYFRCRIARDHLQGARAGAPREGGGKLSAILFVSVFIFIFIFVVRAVGRRYGRGTKTYWMKTMSEDDDGAPG